MTPIERTTARVLPVSPDGAVLLLQDHDPAHPDARRWGTVGGGVDPGESIVAAALRELHEETGIAVVADRLIGPFHHVVRPYTYDGVDYVGDHTFFGLALDRDVVVSFDHLVPDEIGTVHAAGWWTADELVADGAFLPPDLPEIIRSAVAAVEATR